MLITSNVVFKGNNEGLTIVLKEGISIEKILEEIEGKILINKNFFSADNLKISFKGRDVTTEEEDKIINLMKTKTGIEIEKQDKADNDQSIEPKVFNRIPEEVNYNNGIDLDVLQVYSFCEGKTKFYKGTVRSGQRVSFNGNVVILGDINAGAEVVSSGNIVVFGFVRGIVHAGSKGDKNAVVVGLGLQPVQLRIAGIITCSPDEPVNVFTPEIAYVKGESIFIEPIETRVKI